MNDEQLLSELGKEENWRTMTNEEVLTQARKDERKAVIEKIKELPTISWVSNVTLKRGDYIKKSDLLAQLEKEEER